ncbi:hypothetical protein ACMFL9_27345 [Sinorhizobium meliloti]
MPFVESNPKPEFHEFKLQDGTRFKLPKSPAHNLTSIKPDPFERAMYLQKQREQHQADQLAFALLGLMIVAALAIIYSKRRTIFAASENAMVSTLAIGVRAKRRARAYGDRIKTRAVEKADGEKASPPAEWR